jgi:hypothetical protein
MVRKVDLPLRRDKFGGAGERRASQQAALLKAGQRAVHRTYRFPGIYGDPDNIQWSERLPYRASTFEGRHLDVVGFPRVRFPAGYPHAQRDQVVAEVEGLAKGELESSARPQQLRDVHLSLHEEMRNRVDAESLDKPIALREPVGQQPRQIRRRAGPALCRESLSAACHLGEGQWDAGRRAHECDKQITRQRFPSRRPGGQHFKQPGVSVIGADAAGGKRTSGGEVKPGLQQGD